MKPKKIISPFKLKTEQGDQEIGGKIHPNFVKSSPNSCQNIYNKAQF